MDDEVVNAESVWTPDRETVRWWMGAASEAQIVEPFIREVRRRGADIRYDTDAYWHLIAEVAVRLIVEDMPVMAEQWRAMTDETKRWLAQNPNSEEAKNARWRASLDWAADPETVRWWTTLATGDRIVESLEREVKDRGGRLALDSDDYWHLVAEVAVEHMHFELYDTATAWGTEMSDPIDDARDDNSSAET